MVEATIVVREADSGDFEHVVALHRAHYRGHFTLSAAALRSAPAGTYLVAADDSGILAAARVRPHRDPATMRMEIFGESPAAWNALADRIRAAARESGANAVISVVRSDRTLPVTLLASTGYGVAWTSWAAHAHLAGHRSRRTPEPAGFRIGRCTRAQIPEAHALYAALRPACPSSPIAGVPHYSAPRFAERVAAHHLYVATANGEVAAMTLVVAEGAHDVETEFVLTAPAHRRTGLARAVCARAMDDLSAQGVRAFGIGGAGDPGPLRGVLAPLGYRFDPPWLTFRLDLGGSVDA